MSTQEGSKAAIGTWSSTEDERLRSAVAKHGLRWVLVAAEVGTRNGEQCAKRWNDYVKPDLDHSPWTAQEDQRLLPIVASYGHNWKHIAENFLPMRAPLSIKNRYALLMRRQKRRSIRQHQRNMAQPTLPTPNTRLSGDHTPCGLDLFAVHSNESFSNASRPEAPQFNGTADMSELFSTSTLTNETEQNYDLAQFTGQHVTSIGWQDENSACKNLDLSSLFTVGANGNVDHGQQPSPLENGGDRGMEFSVTCSRSMLKAMVCCAFDGAMSKTAGMSEEEPVTVTLRLKK